jgi:hypothetical protein
VNKILEIQLTPLGIARSSPTRRPLVARSSPTHRPLATHGASMRQMVAQL